MNKFLIVSSSVTHEIAYAPLPQERVVNDVLLRQLIGEGLTFPQGLAVDAWRRYLYVADPTLNRLVYYVLTAEGEDKLYASKQFTAADGVEVRWVSCDALGNVYFTTENTQKVLRITPAMLDSGNVVPEIVYATPSGAVSAPSGIIMDNYYVYWLNKLDPTKAGTVVKALHAPNSTAEKMANIDAKCYGICMTGSNVFFTDETKNLYALPRLGGVQPTKVFSNFSEARGCAYDGSNTLYVADKKKNTIFGFPANMVSLGEKVPLSVTAYMEGAYGVAVYTVSESGRAEGLSARLLSVVLSVVAVYMWLP
jgi:sugar lactone lactonase YvrE